MDETSFVAGPALAGVPAWAVPPAAGLVCAAALMAVFGTLFAPAPPAPPAAARTTASCGRWRRGSLLVLLAVTVLQGALFGATNTGVQHLARGDAGAGRLVWSAMGVSSAAAGFLLTSFCARFDQRRGCVRPWRCRRGPVAARRAAWPCCRPSHRSVPGATGRTGHPHRGTGRPPRRPEGHPEHGPQPAAPVNR
ncbi:hypothetical protein [Kitasatospora cathayae]|uniref:Major facilitator superfamily (MFS) profile domain-containing protein n=1 Tax=Kitasatospora cathayae TaxID=3004092 RepID=A0ABY7QET0_9ACTN|nr:hypothetical protein [Kitasatospora sp. HUAS 3-15]WBP91032.1 hypothetical protein O1G21_37640 [Kitasatospora sp. HUAS 3-15]